MVFGEKKRKLPVPPQQRFNASEIAAIERAAWIYFTTILPVAVLSLNSPTNAYSPAFNGPM